MPFSLPQFSFSLRGRSLPPLAGLLTVAWWVATGLLVFLLAADALVFYRYGFNDTAPSGAPAAAETFRVHAETIKKAADIIAARQAEFEAAPSVPSDLPDPFR